MSGNITKSSPFLTVEFITLNLIMLLAFTNLAVFFDFYGYLKELNIPTEWCGLLVGLVSATALVLRPFISMALTPKNAIAGIATGLLLAALSLLLYEHARTVTQFVLLRVVHGTAWVFLGSSLIVLLVASLPLARSGQGFSIITIMTLLPYAIVPLVIDNFIGQVSQGQLYRYTAFLMLPPLLLLIPLWKRQSAKPTTVTTPAPVKVEIRMLCTNLLKPQVVKLLAANAILYAVFSVVFFFLRTYCGVNGIGNTGYFFTLSTGLMIAIRIFMGPLFDRYNRAVLAAMALVGYATSLFLLGVAHSDVTFYLAALLYGLSLGMVVPLLNALMLLASPGEYREFNTNMMVEAMDVGFVAGPFLCGMALSSGLTLSLVLMVCGGVAGGAVLLVLPRRGKVALP